ncbi:MAG: adenosylmethionine--8-amino-7-oxononanoate transaminase [Candidatus Hydrogenedentota bacterium]|nr:MAG: adenosylmethionine--8-amino-7-oxononanoate transaminase [Candidatus Hydrogenedentota bacterium]
MIFSEQQRRRLREIDTRTVWHPFTQMQAYREEKAPIIASGKGVMLTDIDGRTYLDGVSSLWCNVHGHRHPKIDEAIRRQLDQVAHSTLLGLGSVPSIDLAERLAERTGLSHIFYADSGAAAVEIALKILYQYHRLTSAKVSKPRRKYLAFHNAYHGDTIGAVSVGGIEIFHEQFRPLLFETRFLPSPYPFRWEGEDCLGECLAALERALEEEGDELVAVILEPLVQGAAGMIVHPEGFLAGVRDLTRRYGIPLICDEVATGFGRTGTLFAIEQEDVSPDVLVLGKGITGGYLPLSAALFTTEIYEAFLGEYAEFRHFLHGHTYTGNALACAAALASLDIFEEEKVLEKLPGKIARVREELAPLEDNPIVGEVRGRGLMMGIELVREKRTREPFPPEYRAGHRVTLEARKRGLIIRPLGNVVVLMPPLSSTEEELARMCGIIRESIEVVANEP